MSESDDASVVVTHHSSDGRSDGFIKENPEGGFITIGSKLYFATREPSMPAHVLDALGLQASAGEIAGQDAYLPEGWHVYDVSQPKAIDARIMALVGRLSTYDGPRCYSAVFYALGSLEGPINLSSEDFVRWAHSPLAQEVQLSELKAGDVIAVGPKPIPGVPVEHVALVLEKGLIFQKANPNRESPFELLTQKSFDHRYAGQFFKYYHPVKSFANYYASIRPRLPAKAQESLTKVQGYELGLPHYFLTRLNEPDFPWDLEQAAVEKWSTDYEAYYDEASDFGMAEDDYAKAQLAALTFAEEELKYFWTDLADRLNNLFSQGTPFD